MSQEQVFNTLRKKLPHRYMADLQKLLPELKRKRIMYAMDEKCKDLELKEQVKEAIEKLIQKYRERQQKLGSTQIE